MSVKCLIVDDEPPAQRIIERFLNDIPSVTMVGKCKNAFEAGETLNKQKIDLIFLDINMPKLSGLSFLRTLQNPPAVIITTAYREYALEGYELDVVDYLKKPFSFERFYKAVNKALERISSKIQTKDNSLSSDVTQRNYLFIKEDKVTYKIDIDDILFVESVGDYNKVHTLEKVYLAYQTLKKLQDILPEKRFVRVHKSFIIALDKIENIKGNQLKIEEHEIPIGQTFRKDFFDLIEA